MACGSQRCSLAASAAGDLYVYTGLRRMVDVGMAIMGVIVVLRRGEIGLLWAGAASGAGTLIGYRDPTTVVVNGSTSTSIAAMAIM